MRRRIGVFGGTFDPVHVGHLIIAEEALAALRLDSVLFVPAGAPPHKPESPVSAPEHRVRMLEAAVDTYPRFGVSRIDIDRPGPHYTVDMLQLVADVLPGADVFFLIGADSLSDLPTWRTPSRILDLATIVVARRPFVELDMGDVDRAIPGIADRVTFMDSPLIGISATDIRQRVRQNRPIRHQIPPGVEAYILRTGLYRA